MIIRQGDIFSVDLGEPLGSEPGYVHPVVVVQNNVVNKSQIKTIIVCQLSTTLRLKNSPGNVLLVPGEANLREQTVVNVSQIITVDKEALVRKIGTVDVYRMREILDGIRLLTEPKNPE